ncbi:uncharacterized protein ATC70_001262 [Mucor velutinosus]|uniref:K Homology domain-containing protein n=1 Tax=Mucor velutinosus TaxID=708070 RepID=A0AAN7I1M9_9FUNG|nr:hypothetical protein ATC70_001262 [Mucor velutinosus]
MNIHSFCLSAHHNHQIKKLDVNQLNQHFSNNETQVQFVPLYDSSSALNVLIKGQHVTACMKAKSAILRNNPVKAILSVESPTMDALYHPEIKGSLTDIAQEFEVEVKVHATSEAQIHMVGSIDSVELARVKILVLLDQLAGLNVDTLPDIPHHLHFLIAGRKHVQLQAIMEETSTNIYLQSPLCNLLEENSRNGMIYLTGESPSDLARAKDLLKKLAAQKIKSMHRKDSNMDSKKLDWILLNKRDQLRKIMRDNGSYFKFPILGSGSSSISIFAENRIYVERSIRLLNHLTSNIYEASFDLINPIQIQDLPCVLSQLSQSSGVDITYQPQASTVALFGTEAQVCTAYRLLGDMPFVKGNHQFTMFSLELATDQREFVSGKKNGKINKIMKTCAVTIRFTVSNEYNSYIIVESTNHSKALEGLTMLQDELPAETSFYVPEIYHRRIIGVAGKNIQKVMKKYGVYVKFSGAEEFASLGGYFENEDNVVARTPMKNQMNLEHLKLSVTEFIGFQKDKDFVSTVIAVPYDLQRILPSKYGGQLRDMCRTNNAKIWWPERLGSDNVVIYGPQTQISSVAAYLAQFVSRENHIAIALSGDMEVVLSDPNFVSNIQMKIHTALQDIELLQAVVVEQPNYKNSVLEWNSGYLIDSSKVMVFRLLCHDANHINQDMEQARDIIRALIESKKFQFKELSPIEQEPAYISQGSHSTAVYKQSCINSVSDVQNHLLPSSILANTPAMSEDPMFDMLDSTIPSPPLSESFATPYHPHDKSMPFIASSLLSAPFPTARNIWASPRIQNNNTVPPLVQSGEQMYRTSQYPPGIQPPLSPPPQQPSYHHAFSVVHQGSSLLSQQRNLHIRPSHSAPTIGTRHQPQHDQQLQQQPHHKSWPDVFFGGRDLFDNLPSRRASASTQYAFELYPNSTTTSSTSSPSMHQQQQQQQQQGYQHSKPLPMMSKYQQQFEMLAQNSPFVYSNAPQFSHSSINGPPFNNMDGHYQDASYTNFNPH